MAHIQCPQCDKIFRGKTGFQWHMERIHSQTQQPSDQVNSVANLHQPEDAAQFENPQTAIEALEKRLENVAASVKELMGRLGNLGDLESQVNALRVGLSSVENEIGSVKHALKEHEKWYSHVSVVRTILKPIPSVK